MNNTKTELVNVANDGSKGNSYAENSVISANGRYVVFESDADNLVANDTNLSKDIFVRDLVTGTTQRVSVNSEGSQGNNNSANPVTSADGRYVVFESNADNLIANDTNFAQDIFVRDLVTVTTQRVSVNIEGSQGNNNSANPVISADGRYVAFESDADNLIANDTNLVQDIFVRDLVNGTTQRVNLANDGSETGLSSEPSISAEGRYVAFTSYASNLVFGDSNNTADVFVRDLVNGTTQRVSITNGGFELNNQSRNPSISADGRYVAFESDADNLVPGDINEFIDIFVRDLVNGTTKLVSISKDGSPSLTSPSLNPSISADGHYVVFESFADNLVADDTNFAKDIFIRDLVEEIY